jgi:Protein of unknown function (DUF3078)
MKQKLIILFFIALTASLTAQEKADSLKPWKFTGETSLSFSQVSLSNWAAGGESSMGGNSFLKLAGVYTKDRNMWENKLDLAYGLLKQGDEGMRKTDDKMFFSSSYGYKASKNWYYNAILSFKSQFTDGYKYPNDSVEISRFLAPAYILAGIGMDYKPNDKFSMMISPIANRITIVNDDTLSAQGAYGVDPGKKSRWEFGGSFIINIKRELVKNVSLTSKLELFTNYADNPQNVDINWEVFINMKINEFLSANISTSLIYDDDVSITDDDGKIGPRTQFKEVFGIGLSYKF